MAAEFLIAGINGMRIAGRASLPVRSGASRPQSCASGRRRSLLEKPSHLYFSSHALNKIHIMRMF
ncbi:hypothetical protein [Burkholderia lata]|uniref:hypothetical protein n=1 Tax=Burkholderia lata (strain ATCC 17760 / DSM 23089 / LMG 22485 / NCIMB 9086 / R18194 / 383) TaxID=482957 RepID=UPI0020C5E78F|nr:hypothetical protein [Burkholderia lata]